MAEHPILFTGEMVRAILEDRKTQTRRVVKPQPELTPSGLWTWRGRLYGTIHHESGGQTKIDEWMKCCPYGVPGDLLWLKETVQTPGPWNLPKECRLWYPADGPCPFDEGTQVKSARFMPKWACRLWLEVVEVRVQRVQEISEADAMAEGIIVNDKYAYTPDMVARFRDADGVRASFAHLWDSINARPKLASRNPYTGQPEKCQVAYPWDAFREETTINRKSSSWHDCKVYIVGNPFVWPMTFKRRKSDG